MTSQFNLPVHLKGLTDDEVITSRQLHGLNTQYQGAKNTWWKIILSIFKEPMLIILLFVSAIYFTLGQKEEGYFMVGAIFVVSGLSFYQDNRSRIAIEALQVLNAPNSLVIRNGLSQNIPTADIVPGDLVIAEEGGLINADGAVMYSHDFSVNESSLTGEAYAVFKSTKSEDQQVYSGTMVSSGMAVYKVISTGLQTKLGKLGTSLSEISEEPSPLQQQINAFVKKMSIGGIVIFLLIWLVSFLKNHDLLDSLLKGLTLAMSILPEEIPVAFITFMALGSKRLIREDILVKNTRTVETLGNATVICIDKTGTITENKMSLQGVYVFSEQTYYDNLDSLNDEAIDLIEAAMWASEPNPFDPMEKTIHDVYEKSTVKDKRTEYSMIHEYPLGGIPPMMTHIFENQDHDRIIAAKGAPEAILNVCGLTSQEKIIINDMLGQLAVKGYRILGVARTGMCDNPFPTLQQEIKFTFLGLLAFFDPPKKNIQEVFDRFDDAGVKVKIITGDNALTTQAIAQGAGFRNGGNIMDGDVLMKMDASQQIKEINRTNIFTRMFPDAKLVVINALKKDHQVVAMIGDGVNDGPALKASDIGIAMGQKGTEIAKSAADLILLKDDLSKMMIAIATGRRIYTNLKKAVQYIISIHIPIILTVSLPLFLGWIYPNIFTPVHVIFLELIMGPTCSIVYENEPIEKNAMHQPPRPLGYSFLNWREMMLSILQGLIISAGVLFTYQYSVRNGGNEEVTRTMVFGTLILSNIFLTLVNRSFYYSFFESLKNKNNLLLVVLGVTVSMLFIMIYIPVIRSFFHLAIPSVFNMGVGALVAAVSVFWFEIWKWQKRKKLLSFQIAE
ncbi:MAG TPA: cation-translocating P-type ATPase [Saprospiraceae bacterium]|nr:cation-translocating P-type ATPase [Saprospiraceae bacterium]